MPNHPFPWSGFSDDHTKSNFGALLKSHIETEGEVISMRCFDLQAIRATKQGFIHKIQSEVQTDVSVSTGDNITFLN
jgi:hypothetical protein